MSFRLTILCDNTVGPVSGTLGEHGFAALVEHPGGMLLFDTGQGQTLLANARRLNKDLRRVETVVLSHGHYDHTGGLLPLLTASGGKRVLAHSAVFSPRYRCLDGGEAISVGMPFAPEELAEAGAHFELSAAWREIAPQIALTGQIPRVTPFETGDRGIFSGRSCQTADTVADDQSLVISSPKGLVLLLGCCHAGLVNTITLACQQTGVDQIYAVIGGTHLGFCDQEQLRATSAALRRLGVKKICAGHCTGFAAAARLARDFPKEFHPAAVGYTLEV
jgi:7,8-dihydropterin-6-yl-methyl-4-(beta-D-ribofuranosyl)aminobenzene 5'-phosphate synthase